MKILAIRIKNLASIEGEFEIDFKKEPLKSAGIFAITGSTGSGKSTILDAICLALFAKTPRNIEAKENGIDLIDNGNNKIKQGDIRSILRKGCSNAYAEVDFIGIDKQTYRASWNVRRAGNKVNGNLQSDTIELLNLESNLKFPEKKTETLKEIERLLGLNYEQFTRSVLLAQGDFTAFLKAEKDEKSSLLEKLTGTEIYSDISKKIYENYKNSETELRELNIKIEGIKTLPDYEYIDIINKRLLISSHITEIESIIQKNIELLKWLDELSKFEKELEESKTNLNKTIKNKEANNERQNKLTFIEAIQDFKISYKNNKIIEDALLKKTEENKIIAKETQNIQLIINKLSENKINSENLYQNSISEKNKAQILIDKAKELDIIISEKKEQFDFQNKEINKDIIQKQETENKISININNIKQLNKEQDKIKIWEKENENRRKIADNILLINSKLADLKKIFVINKGLKNEINDYIKKNNEYNNLIAANSKIIEETETKLFKLKNEFSATDELVKHININKLSNDIIGLNIKIEKITKGIGIWKLYSQNEEDCKMLQNTIDKGNEIINKHIKTLENSNKSLKENTLKKEQTQKILTKAEIATTESVEKLRQHLNDDEECPVCGSTQHPYIKGIDKIKNVLEEIRSEVKILIAEHETLVKEIAGLESIIIKINSDIEVSNNKLKDKSKDKNELYKSWKDLEIEEFIEENEKKDKIIWMENELLNTKNEMLLTQNKITNFNITINKINTIKTNITDLEKNKALSINLLEIYNTDLKNTNTNLLKTEQNYLSNEKDITEIRFLLNSYFVNQDWFLEWEKNNDYFEDKLKHWNNEWLENLKKAEILKNKIYDFESENKKDNDNLELLSISIKSKQAFVNNINEILLDLNQKRNEIFGGSDIKLIENQFLNAIENSLEELTQIQKKLTEHNNELIRLTVINEKNNIELIDLKDKLILIQNEIQKWINDYNLANNLSINLNDIQQNLNYNQDWIDSEKQYFKQENENIIRLNTTYEEKETRFKTHLNTKPSTTNAKDATEIIKSKQILLEEQKQIYNELDFKIKTNENNQKLISNYSKEIEFKTENFENWQKINDLIGSADGKKFRQIAQEYTLDILLNYANKQLDLLSNRYYLNRIENTLALQVIDREMGNETRSVYSLSGGESFIVSLALALGLASLSSNKMQIESLFIDEGFGSLDPSTLSIAMDALEQLYNQGRKVGVISHIQEMTERIPTQIKVIKQINGKSRIEISRN